MTHKIINGDYVFDDNGRLQTVEYIDEVIQNVVLALFTKRGRFYPDKDYGSYIRFSDKIPEAYLLAYARQAVDSIDGVYIKSAEICGKTVKFKVWIHDEERTVSMDV